MKTGFMGFSALLQCILSIVSKHFETYFVKFQVFENANSTS